MAEKRKPGRPSIRTKENAVAICAALAEGRSLRSVCEDDGMPSLSAVMEWLNEDRAFAEQYARACEARADCMAEDLLEIADDARNDWMERHGDDDAGWVANGEHIQRSRLRVDARKWLMSKMKPKKYGDKLDLEHSGPGGAPIPTTLRLELVKPK